VKWLEKQKEHVTRELQNASQEYPSQEAVEAQLKEIIHFVMVHIRFPMMSPHQLAALLISPTVQSYKEFFIERMAIGMSFHSGKKPRDMFGILPAIPSYSPCYENVIFYLLIASLV